MGTDRTDYIILGVKVSFSHVAEDDDNYNILLDLYEDNAYQDGITPHDGVNMVSDGMNGEYAVVGRILAKSTYEGLPMTDCSINYTQFELDLLARVINKITGLIDPEIKVFAFTHWH